MEKIEERIGEVEKKQIAMGGDITHIKDRLDNGISKTITKIFDMLNDFTQSHNEIKTIVTDHVFWIGVIKKAFIFVAITGVLGGTVAMAVALIKRGI